MFQLNVQHMRQLQQLKYGMNCILPTPEEQEDISDAIYGAIKQNKPANRQTTNYFKLEEIKNET